ncbi:peptide ABC transporter ATP-binding protein [Phyllobacterium sophorae]|uniref:Peptide ABC transporter ATP-binding protein n=1 Tax=Phyllobacterium sophorae TaxID=1520277 RepID=A0A2P7BGC1_9HYPH|nr:peptide ABC transporter ATP-binding protein [Phyllobacterium sophorae]
MLQIDRLFVTYGSGQKSLRAVNDVSLSIGAGEAFGLVGESGSGKSTVALAALRYLPSNARFQSAALNFQGLDLYGLSAPQLRRLRGNSIAAVYQHPGSALNPSMTIGAQIVETIVQHAKVGRDAAHERALSLLERVGIINPGRVARLYPHELSGGMQQRASIAIAISLDPALLIMDEPTTALDASIQSEIIAILRELRSSKDTSILVISHDINLIRQSCDRVAVMQAGAVVETGNTSEVFTRPRHLYTKTLLASIPRSNRGRQLPGELAQMGGNISATTEAVAVKCHGISQNFGSHPVLHDIDLEIGQGETFGLIGESGSGKSTLARIIMGLQPPSSGSVQLFGTRVADRVERRRFAERRDAQMVFQSPDRTLNPRHKLKRILGRPLRRLAGARRADLQAQVGRLLNAVRLSSLGTDQKPRSLSGGQRQRIAIARAFAGSPRLVVLDEPTSALDVSVQATVLNLLNELQRERKTAYLFISHDLRVIRYMADRIGVLYRGHLVEVGAADAIFHGPNHPYTKKLLAASAESPAPAPSALRMAAAKGREGRGCIYVAQCPCSLLVCGTSLPPVRTVDQSHSIACWRDPTEL